MNANHRKTNARVSLKWGLLLMLMVFGLSSCKDDFDVEKLQDDPRLVLYCFPTEGDTTLFVVTRSLPVASFNGDKDEQSRLTVDANILWISWKRPLVMRLQVWIIIGWGWIVRESMEP